MKYGSPELVACFVVSLLLGSIHAFSVFVPEWEALPGASRASVSLIYSIALVSLTVAVLFGHFIYRLLSPCLVFVSVASIVAVGLWGASYSATVFELYFYYGILFGGANGLGYGYTLQLSGQVAPSSRAQAMVLVTAFYAVGATCAPFLFSFLIEAGGNSRALLFCAFIFAVIIFLGAVVVYRSGVVYQSERVGAITNFNQTHRRARWLFWCGYGGAVSAGLMVLGHAYSIARWLNISDTMALWAVTCVAAGNMVGGFSAVYLTGYVTTRSLLRVLPLLTVVGLVILIVPQVFPLTNPVFWVLIGLLLAGYSYGAVIAIYPVAVADTFGVESSARVYGQIFTAWGLAGLLGPWFSGWLYDRNQSYLIALVIAVLLSFCSIVTISKTPFDLQKN